VLTVSESFIESNKAKEGGGVYLEVQTDPIDLPYLVLFEATSIQYNNAAVTGGGIFY